MLPLLLFFSVKCINQLKLYNLWGNTFKKRFASYLLFTGEHLIKYWSAVRGKSYCYNGSFTNILIIAANKAYLTNGQSIFRFVDATFH